MVSYDPSGSGEIICTCVRCGHRWWSSWQLPRIPVQCTRCRSRYWNILPMNERPRTKANRHPFGTARRNPDGTVRRPPPISVHEVDLTGRVPLVYGDPTKANRSPASQISHPVTDLGVTAPVDPSGSRPYNQVPLGDQPNSQPDNEDTDEHRQL